MGRLATCYDSQPRISDEPIEAQKNWETLSIDVLAQVAAKLDLPDLLAAALACKYWRKALTQGK
jgi:hypothetical protein